MSSGTDRDGDLAEPVRVVFVCTGNTCRSPLAAVIARRELAGRGWGQVEAESAGTFAGLGGAASAGSLAAAERHGLDLNDHSARPLTEAIVQRADLLLCMGDAHLRTVIALGGDGKAALLSAFANGRDDPEDGPPIADPFGGDDAAYERTFEELDRLVSRAIDRIEPLVPP